MPDVPSGFRPLAEAVQRYGLIYHQLYKLVQGGLVQSTHSPGGDVLVDVASLEARLPSPGWAWLSDALKRYPLSRDQVAHLIGKGAVLACKQGGHWQVELASLETALKDRDIPPGWIMTREAGRRLGVSAQERFGGAPGLGSCSTVVRAGAGWWRRRQ